MPDSGRKNDIAQRVGKMVEQLKNHTYKSPFHQDFIEIEIEDDEPARGGEMIAPKKTVSVPPLDERRELFLKMRRLSQNIGFPSGPNDRLQAVLFYKQARFMEHYEDDYDGNAAFSMYFPSYQTMGYEQLRTYFSWRSGVRKGIVRRTSFSYVFVYIYELINNIGVENAMDGLQKFLFIWDSYRAYDKKLDRYLNNWVKDYYITNGFDIPFDELLQKNEALGKLFSYSGPETFFDYYYPYSDYKIKQSSFYTSKTEKMINDCFNFVIRSLNEFLSGQNVVFDDLIFYGSHDNIWVPFEKALYCSFSRQIKNRTVQFSETESYRCENGRWTTSKNRVNRKNGRALIGYILRRIERFLRKAVKYKHVIAAERKNVSAFELARKISDPADLFAQVDKAILSYYKLLQRVEITVDEKELEKIRENAEIIQNKLIVEPQEPENDAPPAVKIIPPVHNIPEPPADSHDTGGWKLFFCSLDETERTVLRMVLQNASMKEILDYSKNCGIMPEVLVDTINGKAIEAAGDNIFDFSEEITVFDEYRDELKRVMDSERQ